MEIIGVYQWENYVNVHVIEMLFDEQPSGGDFCDIGQTTNPMMPWDPVFLDDKGEQIIPEPSDFSENTPVRVAFFYHDLDFSEPLLTPWGSLKLPNPRFLPWRLNLIMDYNDPDEPLILLEGS